MVEGAVVSAKKSPAREKTNLVLFFAFVYLAHGFSCGQFGVFAQPIQFFLKDGLRLTAAQVSSYMAVMMLPWVIKPVYGMLCDFVPLFGFRRKSYIIIGNLIAALAFAIIAMTSSMTVVLIALLFTALGMAVSTTLMVGLAVQQGRADGQVREYFAVQEFCYYAATILAAAAGGALCQNFAPQEAMNNAAAIAAVPPLCVAILTMFKLREAKSKASRKAFVATGLNLRRAFKSQNLQIAFAFSFLWTFAPAMGVPLYFFETNSLGFTQNQVGQLSAYNAVGMLTGTVVYKLFVKRLSLRVQLLATIALSCLSTVAYCFLSNFASAVVLELFRGFAGIVVILSLYVLAADFCPRRVEVSVMALLVAIRNVSTDASTFVGGQLFTHVFHNDLKPLVLVSLLAPALSALLVQRFSSSLSRPGDK